MVCWMVVDKNCEIVEVYYVGTHELSAILVASDRGLVLIDGALAESAPQIAGNIRALGFRPEDIKLILNSHAHFDHAAGIAPLQRLSGAKVAQPKWAAPKLLEADGRTLRHHEPINRGAAGRPISHADIVAKFHDNAARAVSRQQADQLQDLVLNIEQVSVAELTRCLGQPAKGRST